MRYLFSLIPVKRFPAFFDLPEFEELKDFISDSEVGFQVSQELKTDISSKIKQLQQLKGIEQIICFIKILSDLMQNKTLHIPLSAGKNMSNHISDNDKRIIDAQSYIRKHFTQQKLTLDDIAEQACLTPQAFCRSFKKTDRHYLYSVSQ